MAAEGEGEANAFCRILTHFDMQTTEPSKISGKWPRRLVRVVPAAAAVCLLAWCFVSLRPDFDWDDADPEILNQAWRFARGESLYRGIDAPPFAFPAYTPLYYALVGSLLRITGLSFLPAKLISFLSTVSIGWALVVLARQWNRKTWDGVWTACLFLLIPAALYNAARSHAQMMAVALSIGSLVFFLRNRWGPTLILSPILAVLAFYTKQTQVALPLAMVAYLACRNRRWLIPYSAVGLAAGLIPFLWLQKATHGYFWLDTVQLARLAYDVRQIPLVFLHHAGPLILFLGLALHAVWMRFKKRAWDPVDFYFCAVLLVTLISLGRLGAHGQYVLELLAATLLLLLRVTGLPHIRGRETLVAAQILILLVYTPLFVSLEEGLWDMASNRAAKQIYPLLQTGSGPILAQQGSFALFGRGEIYVQLFHFCGLARAGLWNQQPLLDLIERRTFSWVITEFPIEEPMAGADNWERFTPEILKALGANYRRREVIYPYYLYAPRLPAQ